MSAQLLPHLVRNAADAPDFGPGAGTSTMNAWLVRGLRSRRVHGSKDWRELVTDIILGRWPTPAASAQTLAAEHGLGIDGKPYYFFVLRANENFGRVVFVLEDKATDWPSDAKGATPFDSGGLWAGAVGTNPKLDHNGRRALFQSSEVRLEDWKMAFEKHVSSCYAAPADYIGGRPPAPEEQPHQAVVVHEDERTWTWEVRVPYDLITGRLLPRAACMTHADRSSYLRWVRHVPRLRSESERRQIQQWVKAHVSLAKEASVAQTVEDWLNP